MLYANYDVSLLIKSISIPIKKKKKSFIQIQSSFNLSNFSLHRLFSEMFLRSFCRKMLILGPVGGFVVRMVLLLPLMCIIWFVYTQMFLVGNSISLFTNKNFIGKRGNIYLKHYT